MGALGVSRDQIWGSAEIGDTTHTPLSPLKKHLVPEHESTQWQQCDTVVSRVSRLLQTLKLSIFPLESEHELAPSHTANLKQDLAALQQENEKEQKTCWREVMKLRDQLQQVYQERHDAHTEVQKRCETIDTATAAKKGWDAAKGDKKRPVHSLEQAVLTNCREQYQAISLRI
ncbi:Coiled-coil domain-containing protein 150 [Channa argus]|uniref:Coiled-coil domain-containing protein 150 n=1 Tax=Channa argus TaxID=215402 RepID=A0A6G1PSK9_CHAAH|nr:Coiled-coil domain-containing protein 150 [Channa argus]